MESSRADPEFDTNSGSLFRCTRPAQRTRNAMPRTKEKAIAAKLPPNYPGHEKAWRLLFIGRLIDNVAPNFLRKAMGWSYHAPNAGHDAIQLALGCTFRP